MDLVAEEQRESLFKDREEDLIRLSRPGHVTCFRTSIWDETLYRLKIIYMLSMNLLLNSLLMQGLVQYSNNANTECGGFGEFANLFCKCYRSR